MTPGVVFVVLHIGAWFTLEMLYVVCARFAVEMLYQLVWAYDWFTVEMLLYQLVWAYAWFTGEMLYQLVWTYACMVYS